EAPCRVEGKVTYNNNPVGGGTVYFHSADGVPYSVPIFANGTYTAELKEGTYTVTVDTESLNPAKKKEYRGGGGGGAAAKMYGGKGASGGANPSAPKGGAGSSPSPEGSAPQDTYVKIPSKYTDKATSGLSITPKKGKNEYNITMSD